MLAANKLGALGLLLSDAMAGAQGDISRSAAALLFTLLYRPGITATELASVAGVAQPTAVRVLAGLTGRGWLKRQARRGRATPLRLTPAGQKQAQALQAARLRALNSLLAPLPKPDRADLDRIAGKILAAATTSRAAARTTCRLCDHVVCDGPDCPVGLRATALEQAANEPAGR